MSKGQKVWCNLRKPSLCNRLVYDVGKSRMKITMLNIGALKIDGFKVATLTGQNSTIKLRRIKRQVNWVPIDSSGYNLLIYKCLLVVLAKNSFQL